MEEHKEQRKEYAKKYYLEHKEKYREYSRKYHQEHKNDEHYKEVARRNKIKYRKIYEENQKKENRKKKEEKEKNTYYAVYLDDDFEFMGNIYEVCEYYGWKKEYAKWLNSPAVKKRKNKYKPNRKIYKIEDDDEEE